MKKLLLFTALLAAPIVVLSQSKIVINPSVGYAWRTAEKPDGISPEEKDYLNDLSKGFNFDIGAYYMIKPDWGLGLKYNQFQASGSYNFQGLAPDNSTFSARINTKDNIMFIGPGVFGTNFSSESKHKYISGIALGYISYTSSLNGIEIKGSNVGLVFDLGYQYQVTPNISVGPQIGITAGTLSKIEVEGENIDLPDDSKESLNRISLGLGANFRF